MTDSEATVAFACGYSENGNGGVVTFRPDRETGGLIELNRENAPAASFLAVHPDRRHLYTVNRVSGGVVTAYEIDPETYDLTRIDRTPTGGTDPCYLSLDETGRYAFVSNYSGGTVAMAPIEADGTFGEETDVVEHEGSSVDPDRQATPHPHSIAPGPDDRYVYAPDLGADRIATYQFDTEGLHPTTPPGTRVHEGAGPRHFEFDPEGRYCYVINELDSTITTFEYDSDTGELAAIETVGTLPEEYAGENFCADVHVHPSGDWLYGSNRGHDSIAIFAIDDTDGCLRLVDHESTRGHWPRHFALDPTGSHLYVENRRSDAIVPFAIDEGTGRLTPTAEPVSIPEPVCLRFAAVE